MPRPVTHGTPSLSPRYMRPRKSGVVRWSAIGAAALLAILGGVYAIGLQTGGPLMAVASPGSVAAGHAAIDTRCAQCHQPAKAASDLRCERCHDPVDSRRFENGAHAIVSGHDTWHALKSAPAATVPCAMCHDDHRGHAKPLSAVEDRRCATCHDFASFNRHPEFSVVRARRGPDEGMEFSHFIHLREITKVGGERCTSCHVMTADQVRFEPINFDAHCARCHIKDGGLTLNGTDLLASGFAAADLLLPGTATAPRPQLSAPDGRGRVTFRSIGHRDPWVIENLARLSRALAADAIANERAHLETEQGRLAAIVNAAPLSLQADRDLLAWRDDLRRDVASPPSGAAIDPALADLASQVGATPRTLGSASAASADAKSVDERKQELQSLLDAVGARTRGPLADRAAALKKRLAAIAPDQTAAATVDGAALGERLNDVDSALTALESSLRTDEAADIAATRDAVRHQLVGGADQARYIALKKQLMNGVDALAASGDPGQRARIAELRSAVAALPDQVFGPSAIDRLRDRARLLERLDLELMLRPVANQASPNMAVNAERGEARRQLQQVTGRLASLSASTPDLDPSEVARAKPALRGLVGACLGCHRLNEDETNLRATALNGPVMPDARYSHKPHILQQVCETCHNTIQASKSASDANVPGVATCQSCHKPSQARNSCSECHAYHPRSSAELIMAATR